MADGDARLRSPAVERLRQYGMMSTALGVTAVIGCVIIVCLTEQRTALTELAFGTIALQLFAVAALFLPAFSAFRSELRTGVVRVDPAKERAAMGKPPLWLIVAMAALFAISVAQLIWTERSTGIGLVILLVVVVILSTRGWPTHETQAQQAASSAGLGMFGLQLSMIVAMFAGIELERSGALNLPEGVALLGLTALMVVPAMAVFFSTLIVIRRAAHAL